MTSPRKPVFGLIGAIGAGKSSVAAAMAKRGGTVIDADRIGHGVLELPAVKSELVAMWGERVLKPDGTANRREIAGIVFPDSTERKKLESVVFPRIRQQAEERISAAMSDPNTRFVVVDAAVMLEAGWNTVCDRIVYVDAPREQRLHRLAARSGWNPEEVAAREASQLPTAEKLAHADAVLMNDGSPDDLQQKVDALLLDWMQPN